jgi:lipopolysaccharide assembly outer membrane protein LptD (OstA)
MGGRIRFPAFPAALWAVLCVISALPAFSVPASAASVSQIQTQAVPAQEEITVYARSQEKTKDRIFLVGDVEVRYKDLRLFADRVEIDPKTKDCVATGNVTIQLPGESMNAEKIFVNLETKLGRMEKADGMVQPTIFYHAASVDKKAENLYELLKAQITSCSQPVPRWKFSTSRAKFKKDDSIEMWNAVFSIKKVPVFYWPYMRYPVGRDRATGFLMPQIGWSGNKGFNYQQGFFWAIARNMDATIHYDYYSARGMGGALQFRYLFSKGTGGELNLYGFTFKRDASGNKRDDATILRLNHNQPLPLGFNLVANVDLQSSYDFLREFDNNFKRAVISNRSSQVYLQRAWSYFNLSARVSKFETFFNQSGLNRTIVSKSAPQISFSMFKVKLFSPLYVSFESSYSRTQYGLAEAYKNGTQRKTGSLMFSPTLSAPFTSIPWLTMNTAVTGSFNYYPQSYEPGTSTPGSDPLFTKSAAVGVDVVGPVFSKVYRNKQGDPVFKHVIEPSVSYHYDSPISQAKRIVTTYARFFQYHTLQYGITNRFYIKENDQPREVVQLGLTQTYYLAPEEGPLSLFRFNGKVPRFSEITGTLRCYPAAKYSLDVSAGYNPYYKILSSMRLSANLGSRTDDRFLSLSWFKSTSTWIQNELTRLFGNRHQVSVAAGIKLPNWPIEVMGDIDFNIKERKLLYTAGSAVYHYQCLDFTFEVKVFYFRTKPETQFKFSLGLGNIGKTTDFLGGF